MTITTGEADPPPVVIEGADPPPAATEAVADAAVEIAEIEADRDVAIAKISAGTTAAIVEAEGDDEWRSEVSALQARTESLAAENAELAGRLAGLETALSILTTPLQGADPPPATPPEGEGPATPPEGEGPATPPATPPASTGEDGPKGSRARKRRRWL